MTKERMAMRIRCLGERFDADEVCYDIRRKQAIAGWCVIQLQPCYFRPKIGSVLEEPFMQQIVYLFKIKSFL